MRLKENKDQYVQEKTEKKFKNTCLMSPFNQINYGSVLV
jgi:hypothetical protein